MSGPLPGALGVSNCELIKKRNGSESINFNYGIGSSHEKAGYFCVNF